MVNYPADAAVQEVESSQAKCMLNSLDHLAKQTTEVKNLIINKLAMYSIEGSPSNEPIKKNPTTVNEYSSRSPYFRNMETLVDMINIELNNIKDYIHSLEL